MIGPGKYDAACTAAREATSADAVLLIVINGGRGDGFSFQTSIPELAIKLPYILRMVAREIEEQG